MILSMTGFGGAEAEADGIRCRVEIRSQNNRYYKSSIKLPEELQPFEVEIDRLMRSRLGRGSLNYTLRIKDETPTAAYEISPSVLNKYVSALRKVAKSHDGLSIDLASLLEAPGVCQPPDIGDAVLSQRFEIVKRLTEQAITRLIEMRRAEGAALSRDLQEQCAEIRTRLAVVQRRSPAVVEEYRKRLHQRVQQLMDGGSIELDHEALVREVAVFAERCDVNEEVARLASHLDQFTQLCEGPEEAGRKLDFLAQEMLREANTTGSKANDSEIARQVVEIKSAIDRIKEQVQNVE